MSIVWILVAIVLALGVLIGLAGLVLYLMGRKLPVEHTSFAVIELNRGADEVWAVIAEAARQPEWMKAVAKVEKMPDRNGHTVWKQTMGRNSFTLEEVVAEPPRRLVREITDIKGPFSGSWEFLLVPIPSTNPGQPRVKVRLTERGKIHAAIPRAIMNMFGEDMYLKKYLTALAAKFGQTAKFSND
jgi:hypothetical protein